jgi:hypothetical protein
MLHPKTPLEMRLDPLGRPRRRPEGAAALAWI